MPARFISIPPAISAMLIFRQKKDSFCKLPAYHIRISKLCSIFVHKKWNYIPYFSNHAVTWHVTPIYGY
jgi:hypothetical protein